MRRMVAVFLLVLAMPVLACAASDIVATYTYSDGSMVTLVTRDKTHVRMDTSPTSYLLLAEGTVYSVTCEQGGGCNAVDMAQMMNATGFSGSMFGGGSATQYEVRYERTGRKETVAGYKGAVYQAVVFEDGKVVSRDEMVMGTHSNIKRLTDGWIAMASAMTQTMGQSFEDSLQEARKMGYGGMLRYGETMRLSKLSVRNLNDSYYQLPQTVQQAQVPSQPENEAQQQTEYDPGLEGDANEIGQDAKSATKEEIKDSIRGVISDLFN